MSNDPAKGGKRSELKSHQSYWHVLAFRDVIRGFGKKSRRLSREKKNSFRERK
jgi:hypothetical protein